MSGWDRQTWLYYMLGYLTGAGFKIPKAFAESFKKAFPEVSDDLIKAIISK